MKKKAKLCKACGVPLWTYQPGELCPDCQMQQATDDRERQRVRTIAWAAYHLEHGEPLSLSETAVMADALGLSYGAYSLQLAQQKRKAAIK